MYPPTSKPALILLAGKLHDFHIRPNEWQMIVAADQGASHALRQGILPDFVVGDFDSLPQSDQEHLLRAGVSVEILPVGKDLTDGEAAVRWVLDHGALSLVLAGGLGGRFDHTLGNILLLQQIEQAGARGWVTDGRQRVYLLSRQLVVDAEPGDQLSILPLSPTVSGVEIRGVRWPLQDETLHLGSTRSLSNEVTAKEVYMKVGSGLAIVAITNVKPRG